MTEDKLESGGGEPDGSTRQSVDDRVEADRLAPADLAAESFESFYRAFVPQLVRFLLCQGASFADATEVAQETMRLAHRYWPRLVTPRAWARVVASREMIRKAVAVNLEELSSDPPERAALNNLPHEEAEALEQRLQIVQLLKLLPARQRQVMAWTLDGYGSEEIAAILKISNDAVRSNLYKARRSLAALLSKNGAPS